MLMSHARNEDEIRTPRHRGSPANVDVLAFVILVNPKFMKLGMLSWRVSTCRGKKIVSFGGRFGYKLLINQSFSQQV